MGLEVIAVAIGTAVIAGAATMGASAIKTSGQKESAKREKEWAAHKRAEVATKEAGSEIVLGNVDWHNRLGFKEMYSLDVRDITQGYAKGGFSSGVKQTMEYRHPEPESVAVYHEMIAQIEKMQEDALMILTRAWEAGTAITQQELFAIKQAGDKARHGETEC